MSIVTSIIDDVIKIGMTKGDPYSVPRPYQTQDAQIFEQHAKEQYRQYLIEQRNKKKAREDTFKIVAIAGMGAILYFTFNK